MSNETKFLKLINPIIQDFILNEKNVKLTKLNPTLINLFLKEIGVSEEKRNLFFQEMGIYSSPVICIASRQERGKFIKKYPILNPPPPKKD
jgi:hypothetical protein